MSGGQRRQPKVFVGKRQSGCIHAYVILGGCGRHSSGRWTNTSVPKKASQRSADAAARSRSGAAAEARRLAEPAPKNISLREIFGPGGMLEKCHPGYEFRASQLEMAEIVEEAFRRKQHAIVEAGTGTGKTLAYLIPAIRSGRRVVVSTATKSLQEQLFEKDVPFLQKHFAPKLKVAVMKGRSNFLCREKVYRMADQPKLKGLD